MIELYDEDNELHTYGEKNEEGVWEIKGIHGVTYSSSNEVVETLHELAQEAGFKSWTIKVILYK
jgi:hypothetical protein